MMSYVVLLIPHAWNKNILDADIKAQSVLDIKILVNGRPK
jgi:hypothetical protein